MRQKLIKLVIIMDILGAGFVRELLQIYKANSQNKNKILLCIENVFGIGSLQKIEDILNQCKNIFKKNY